MHQDPISDLVSRIKNATMAKLSRVAVPSSKFKLEILRVLKEEGFVSDYSRSEKYNGVIKVYLKYDESNKPILSDIKRVSKPGCRVYQRADNLPKTLDGLGVTIVSTPRGVMTDRAAKKENLGGEIICQVW
jgi:small subunit ribosomal protein S8